MDLRREVRVTGCRRLWALVQALPPDAAVWRRESHGWSRQDELTAIGVETADAWGRLTFQAMHHLWTGKAPKWTPPPVSIQHPGRPVPERASPPLISDPHAIRRYFAARG